MADEFPDLSGAEERQRRFRAIIMRVSSISEEQSRQLDTCLNAQRTIDGITQPSNIPLNVNTESCVAVLRASVESQSQTIKSNLTRSLGFIPKEEDLKELMKLQDTLGSNFASSVRELGSVINNIEGGINQLLNAIDNKISTAISGLISQAETIVNDAIKAAEEAITEVVNSIIPDINSLIPEELNQLIKDIKSIPEAINEITNIVSKTINEGIEEINTQLNAISTEIQNAAIEFIDTNITGPIQSTIKENMSQLAKTPPEPPITRNEVGEVYPTAPAVVSAPADNPVPIRQSPTTSLENYRDPEYVRLYQEIRATQDAFANVSEIRNIIRNRYPEVYQRERALEALNGANIIRVQTGLPPLPRSAAERNTLTFQ